MFNNPSEYGELHQPDRATTMYQLPQVIRGAGGNPKRQFCEAYDRNGK